MKFLGKELKIVATQGFNALYGGMEAMLYINTAYSILQKYPVDMLVFEMPDDQHYHVRLAGYDFITGKLDETTIAFKTKSLKIEKFWLKIDDCDSCYIGTFLLPNEY